MWIRVSLLTCERPLYSRVMTNRAQGARRRLKLRVDLRPDCVPAPCSGAKTAAVVNAVSALRAKLGGGAESPITGPGGASGIVRALTIPASHVSTHKHMSGLPLQPALD